MQIGPQCRILIWAGRRVGQAGTFQPKSRARILNCGNGIHVLLMKPKFYIKAGEEGTAASRFARENLCLAAGPAGGDGGHAEALP